MSEREKTYDSFVSFEEAIGIVVGLLRKDPSEITRGEKKMILDSLTKLGDGLSSSNPDTFLNCTGALYRLGVYASPKRNDEDIWAYRGKNQKIFVTALEVAASHLKELTGPLSSEESDEKTKEMQEESFRLLNLIIRKKLNPQIEEEIVLFYKDFLPKIVKGMLTGKYEFDEPLFIYLGHYPKEFAAVQNLIDSFLRELPKQELKPLVEVFFSPQARKRRKNWGEKMMELVLKEFGFPAKQTRQFFHTWEKDLCSNENHGEQIWRNIASIFALEQQVPGITNWLATDFGIRHFGRYPLELLLDQYQNRDDKNSPWGVFLYAYFDYTGVFHHGESWMMRDLYEQLRQIEETSGVQFHIRFAEAGNDLTERLRRLRRSYKQASFVVIGGHGNSGGIILEASGKKFDWLLTHQLYSGEIGWVIREFIEPGAPVVFSSCEGGKDEFSPAHAFSRLGFRAIGSDKIISGIGKIKADLCSGKLRFSVVYTGQDVKANYFEF